MNNLSENLLSTLGLFILVIILLFFISRELNAWYWKINERIKLQTRTNELLELIAKKLDSEDWEINPDKYEITKPEEDDEEE